MLVIGYIPAGRGGECDLSSDQRRWPRSDGEGAVTDLLDLFEDATCRAILEATSGEALSAAEIVATCEVSTSSAYRKLNQLTDAGLLEERVRIRRSGNHTSEYVRNFEDVVISLGGDEGMVLCVSHRDGADGSTAVVPSSA